MTNLAALALRLPRIYAAERHDRRLLNVTMFEIFKGISRDRLMVLGEEYCERVLMNRFYAQALDLLEGNRAAGLKPILVTGSPDFVVAALARRLGVRVFAANRLAFSRNLASGRLREPIMAGEEKARWCEEFAARQGLRLRDCWGYADSYYDMPFLTAVGHPVAVNPDRRLVGHGARPPMANRTLCRDPGGRAGVAVRRRILMAQAERKLKELKTASSSTISARAATWW